MKRVAIPAACALISVVVFVALGGWNRSSEPAYRMTLTERELRLEAPLSREEGDDPGVQLRIDTYPRLEPLDARNWLTPERLSALGFVFSVLPGAPEAADVYPRAMPRLAWVAFEYNGPVWQEAERRRAMRAPTPTPERQFEPEMFSRLVPVDAAPDLDTLLRRYPQGHVILRASIALGYIPPSQQGPLVYGWLRDLIPSRVTVPRHLRGALQTGKYDVTLALGRLGVPYVTDIKPVSSR